MKRVHLWISGKVQGVFFRDFIRKSAIKLKVNGWVKNNDDGTVEAVLEGKEDSLRKMVELCEKGTENSKVEKVVEQDEDDAVGYTSFDIKL